jgi:hypothetical protein
MSDDAIEPGSVLHWADFEFDDGDTANKFFVVVGAQPNKNYLAVIATSKQKRGRKPQPGGNPEGGWYCIPGGGKDYFEKDTWLLFEKPVELSAAELLQRKFKNEIAVKGKLRGDVANAICNCMRKCEDVSEYHRNLLGPAIQPKKKT